MVAGLVGELDVDVHHLVVDVAGSSADQDVVQYLRDAVEDVGVLLVAGQRGDQVGEDPRPGTVGGNRW